MTTINLVRLTIVNFMGIRELSIDFNQEGQTHIYGANGTGKSTVFNAFTWLLFAKDSQDKKDFEIKNTVYPELNLQDHEVTAIIDINGRHEVIKRTYREKWVKKQGTQKKQFEGNETVLFWNDVPVTAGDFKGKVSNIIDENQFKLLTNPLFFNSLKWTDRRSILTELAGDISDESVIDTLKDGKNDARYDELLKVLNSGKTLAEWKKQIAAAISRVKKQLEEKEPAIKENLRNLPEPLDFDTIEQEINGLKSDINLIDESMSDRTKAQEEAFNAINAKQRAIHDLKTERSNKEFSIRGRLNDEASLLRNTISSRKNAVESIQENIQSKETLVKSKTAAIENIRGQQDILRKEWSNQMEREFKYDETKFSCPTCQRDFETDNIEESKRIMKENFDSETDRLTEETNKKGLALKNEVASNESLIVTLQGHIEDLKKELADAQAKYEQANVPLENTDVIIDKEIKESPELFQLDLKIKELEKDLSTQEKPEIDISDLKSQKEALTVRIDALKSQLVIKDQIVRTNKRIDELKAEETALNIELTELEGSAFDIKEFTKAKVNVVEDRLNGKFKYVAFKMFNLLVNGDLEETCETMYKGVPFSVLNTAGRIVAGVDVIQTLSDHYKCKAPIWIDNRESISQIQGVDTQLISLIVSEPDTALRVAFF